MATNNTTQDQKSYLDWAYEGKSNIFRYIIGVVLVYAISQFIGQMFAVVGALLIPFSSTGLNVFKLTFFGFIFSFLTLPLIPLLINRRPWWSIAMPKLSLRFDLLLIGATSVLFVQLILSIIAYIFEPGALIYSGVNFGNWILMLPLIALAFFVQASTEEMVFRGYMTQFLYRLSKKPAIFLFFSAFIFAIPHYGNIQGVIGFVSLLPYLIMGLMFGWIAYRSGSLWMPIGIHMANNWFMTVIIGSSTDKIEKFSLIITKTHEINIGNIIFDQLLLAMLTIIVVELFLWKFKLTVKYF
jgi:hypothetical protein